MEQTPFLWLKSFALSNIPANLLEQPNSFFVAAKKGLGAQLLQALASDYALSHQKEQAVSKCFRIDYFSDFSEREVLLLNFFPCLHLRHSPVHLAAVKYANGTSCRVFRLHYPSQAKLYLSEFHLEEKGTRMAGVPSYEEAVSLVFSYTLGTKFPREKPLSTIYFPPTIPFPKPEQEDPKHTL